MFLINGSAWVQKSCVAVSSFCLARRSHSFQGGDFSGISWETVAPAQLFGGLSSGAAASVHSAFSCCAA